MLEKEGGAATRRLYSKPCDDSALEWAMYEMRLLICTQRHRDMSKEK
jgi:hypothetical protein